MGKATRLLRIALTDPSLLPYFEEMTERGHSIEVIDLSAYDRILGPTCGCLTGEMLTHLPKKTLPDLIKEARQEVYGVKGNKRIKES